MTRPSRAPRPSLALAAILTAVCGSARADLTHEWAAGIPVGAALGAGLGGFTVDAAGTSYVTGIAGSSSNTDVVTAAFASDGTMLWSHVFDGAESWHDQARGIALGADGRLYVCGNTPNSMHYAKVLVLEYDPATGTLLDTMVYSSTFFASEHAAGVAADAEGNVYLTGGTLGDGSDALVVKLDAAGAVVWERTWDGPAHSPYSGDHGRQILLDPAGDVVVRIHGVMSSNHPDFVAVKYDPADGSTLWEASWGVNGGDFSTDMEIDAAGDVYMTGTGIDFTDKLSTIKLRGSDGALLWQAYDFAGIDDSARALALDGQGGVIVTGTFDVDGDQSNFNDNFLTVRRDATTGALLWTHTFGANCVGCLDVPSDVLVDPSGNVFVAGASDTAPFDDDVITFVLDVDTGLQRDLGVLPPGTAGTGILRFDATFALYNGGGTYDANTGQKQITVFKYPSQVAETRTLQRSSRPGGQILRQVP